MDPTITLITAGITSIGTLILKHFLDGWKEARGERKTEAQRLAAERDRFRTLKYQWKDACYRTRAVAHQHSVDHHIPPPDFPPTPDDEPH